MNDPEGSQANRRVFLSAPLVQDVRISGTPEVDIRASADRDQTNLGALLVDYGPRHAGHAQRRGDRQHATSSCWGESSRRAGPRRVLPRGLQADHGVTQWRVTRGILDSSNRFGLDSVSPLTPGAPEGVPLAARAPRTTSSRRGTGSASCSSPTTGGLGIAQTTGATVTLDATVSKVSLPIVGGYHGARAVARVHARRRRARAHRRPGRPRRRTGDPSGAVVTYALPAATDDESPDPAVTCDPAPGTRFAVGATVVTCTATDDYGNTATSAFTVTRHRAGRPAARAAGAAPTPVPPTGDTRADTAAPRLGGLELKARQARGADPAAA